MLCFRWTDGHEVIRTTCVRQFTELEYYFPEYSIYLLIVFDATDAVHVALVYFEMENKVIAVSECVPAVVWSSFPTEAEDLRQSVGSFLAFRPSLASPELIPGSPAGAAAPLRFLYILHDGKPKIGAINRNHRFNTSARCETLMHLFSSRV